VSHLFRPRARLVSGMLAVGMLALGLLVVAGPAGPAAGAPLPRRGAGPASGWAAPTSGWVAAEPVRVIGAAPRAVAGRGEGRRGTGRPAGAHSDPSADRPAGPSAADVGTFAAVAGVLALGSLAALVRVLTAERSFRSMG
jgi:hypothetical protein